MTAKLVIHSEVSTADELFEVITLFIKKSADNPFELERIRAYFSGMGKGLAPEQIDQPHEKEKEISNG